MFRLVIAAGFGLLSLASEDDVDSESVDVDGRAATYLRIEGTQERGMLAAILPHEGQVWFFKLKGDQSVADRQEDNFRQFLASFRFET